MEMDCAPVSILPSDASMLVPVSEWLILSVIFSESIYDTVGGCLWFSGEKQIDGSPLKLGMMEMLQRKIPPSSVRKGMGVMRQ